VSFTESFKATEGQPLVWRRAKALKNIAEKKILPQMKVARYLQIENKIRALVKYELAGEVPLVK
jgi:hypothetical protein